MYDQKRLRAVVLLLALLASASPTGGARAQVGSRRGASDGARQVRRDLRVERALTDANFIYSVLPTGNFVVTYNYTDLRRRQECFITSSVERYGGLEVREVWSRAAQVKGQLPPAMALRLLRNEKKFGGWRAVDATSGGGVIIYYSAQIAADADAQTLKSVIEFVSFAADEMEAELTGRDEH